MFVLEGFKINYFKVFILRENILEALQQSQQILNQFLSNEQNIKNISKAANVLINTLKSRNRVFSCGNGGSMSDAMHFAEELTGRFRKHRKGLSAIAISDPGHITCVANDYGFDQIFSRYLESNADHSDCLLGISTSGESKNVIAAAEYAKDHGILVVSLTGKSGSSLGALSDVEISVGEFPTSDRLQEIHIKIIHIWIELIEREFFPSNY